MTGYVVLPALILKKARPVRPGFFFATLVLQFAWLPFTWRRAGRRNPFLKPEGFRKYANPTVNMGVNMGVNNVRKSAGFSSFYKKIALLSG